MKVENCLDILGEVMNTWNSKMQKRFPLHGGEGGTRPLKKLSLQLDEVI